MSAEAEKIFPDQVSWNRITPEVPDDTFNIMAGGSVLNVRRRGGYIVIGILRDPDPSSGVHTNVFYSDFDISVPMPDASFTMMPVGQSSGLGKKHGLIRLVDQELLDRSIGRTLSKMTTRAVVPPYLPQLTTEYELSTSALTVRSILRPGVSSQRQSGTSFGPHNYYWTDAENIDQLRINGETPDELLDETGAIEAIASGEARFWQGFGADFDGIADVVLPGGRRLHISAETGYSRVNKTIGMLLWRRPGTDSIGLEPTIGVKKVGPGNGPEDFDNRALRLGEGVFRHAAALSVTTELRTA